MTHIMQHGKKVRHKILHTVQLHVYIRNSRKGAALAIECRSVLSRLAGEEFGVMAVLYGVVVLT